MDNAWSFQGVNANAWSNTLFKSLWGVVKYFFLSGSAAAARVFANRCGGWCVWLSRRMKHGCPVWILKEEMRKSEDAVCLLFFNGGCEREASCLAAVLCVSDTLMKN